MASPVRAVTAVRTLPRPRPLTVAVVGLIVLVTSLLGVVLGQQFMADAALAEQIKAKGYRKSVIETKVTRSQPATSAALGAITSSGFTTQVRLGHQTGDGWEPAIAADRFGHVYQLYAQYLGVPGCSACKSPTQIVQVSNDRGVTWGAPRVIQQAREQGWDSQIVVDPVDGKTVYAAWIERYKSDVIVARSTDFGATWTYATANMINKGADKPILAVRGRDVYIAYNHSTQTYVASSHDYGKAGTFSEVKINPNAKLGWALAAGGTVTPSGDVFFSWNGYEQNGVAKGPVNLYISKSVDGGATWTHKLIERASGPPNCSVDFCGWAYFGAQIVIASDASGVLYALWNSGFVENGPQRIWFAKSTNAGRTWTAKVQVSTARNGAEHVFPAIAARGSGDVRIAWMDNRVRADGTLFNTYYRSSSNGGTSWAAEKDVSTFVSGVVYIKQAGYEFPFGDYFELDIDSEGDAQVINGQGLNYDTPGAVWYTRGR